MTPGVRRLFAGLAISEVTDEAMLDIDVERWIVGEGTPSLDVLADVSDDFGLAISGIGRRVAPRLTPRVVAEEVEVIAAACARDGLTVADPCSPTRARMVGSASLVRIEEFREAGVMTRAEGSGLADWIRMLTGLSRALAPAYSSPRTGDLAGLFLGCPTASEFLGGDAGPRADSSAPCRNFCSVLSVRSLVATCSMIEFSGG